MKGTYRGNVIHINNDIQPASASITRPNDDVAILILMEV
jgi:hypothetical protein